MSLKDCLKKQKLSKHERAILKGMIDDMTEKDMEENAAAVAAVKARIAEYENSKRLVLDQVVAAGGEVPQESAQATQQSSPAEAERFSGQYGKGMTMFNAKREQKRLAQERPDLTWTVEADERFGPDRYSVVGRKGEERAMFSRHDDVAFAQEVLSELAAEDALFRYPVSKKSTLEGVLADVVPAHSYVGDATREDEKSESGAEQRDQFKTQDGSGYSVYQRGKDVWIDISHLQEGEGGNAIYAAVLNYAHNAGKRLIGDPAGLSEAAVVRRTWAMLSSALRFGTTKHMEAAKEQVDGIPAKGIAPLNWSGDDVDKTRELIDTAISTLEAQNPDVSKFRFDFASRQFIDAAGNAVDGGRFVAGAQRASARSSRSGQATLRAGIFIRSLVSSEGGQRPGILEQVLRGSRALTNSGPLAASFSRASGSGKPLSERDANALAKSLRRDWSNVEAVNLADESKAPSDLRAEIKRQGAEGSVSAAYWNGKVYVFLNKIASPEHYLRAFFHESTHLGLSGLLGSSKDEVMMNLWQSNEGVRAAAQKIMDAHGYDSVVAVEEALAEMGEKGLPASVVDRIVARVRQMLRSLGMNLRVTDGEIRSLVHRALMFAKKGGPAVDLNAPAMMMADDAFVPSADGEIDLGEIPADIAKSIRRQAAPIRLQYGNDRQGLRHIEARRGDRIRKAGLSVEQFVEKVAKTYAAVLQPENTSQLVLAVKNGKSEVAFVQLAPSDSGDFYRVNTAYMMENKELSKKIESGGWKLLWEGRGNPLEKPGDSSSFAAQSEKSTGPTATNAQNQSNDQSLAKDAPKGKRDNAKFMRATTAGSAPAEAAKDNTAALLPKAYKAWAQRSVDRIHAIFDLFGHLEGQNDLLKLRNLTKGKIGDSQATAKELSKAFNKASEADQKAVHAYLITADADPATIADPKVRQAAVDAKDAINGMGDMLVEMGLIDERSREENRDAYLPQLYVQFLADTGAYKHVGGGKGPSNMGYTKGRKIVKRIGPDGEVQLFWKNTSGADLLRKDAGLEPLSREDVLALGPINDPGFLAAMAIARPMRDMAVLEYMEGIAQDERWVLPGSVVQWNARPVSAMWLKRRADLLRRNAERYDEAEAQEAQAIAAEMDRVADEGLGKKVSTEDFVQVPDSPRWGMLRGMHVRKEILDDLQGLAGMGESPNNFFSDWFGYGGKGTRFTSFWKTMKVALNLPGQVRNYVSNNVTMFMSGVPAYRLPDLNFRAWNEFLTKGPLYQQAKATGVFHGTFAAQELSRLQRDLVDLELKSKGWHPIRRIVGIAEKLQDFGGDIYGGVEAVMKLAVIMDRMDRLNMSMEDAAIDADKWLIDYSNVPNGIRYLRGSPVAGSSFITYPYKMAPLIAETALLRPHKLIALYGLGYGLALTAAAMLDVEPDDIDKLRKALPDWLQKSGGATLFIPFKDEHGRWQFFDASYFLPWTYFSNTASSAINIGKDVVEGGSGLGSVTSLADDVGVGGPFFSLAVALKLNIDPFTKRPITTDGAPARVQYLELVNYSYDFLAPPMFSSRGFVSPMGLADEKYGGKLTQALTGQENKFGEPRATLEGAFMSLFGLNIYPVDPKLSRSLNMEKKGREIDDVKRAGMRALTDGSRPPEKRREIQREYSDEAKRRSKLLKRYEEESRVPERLK